mmetsp:Transcript_35729/g.43120  ORF Transcript_35729/g.43120 Transcript_35729/m.43120 type:complete len:362 (-) Transcript_35729:124-1209(-)|eukprot:CAMPEP_0197844668 /NCGR_PEP_ID=MMETSP1438-20131217/1660_1 /TAXON_ID=1461541 /ORGANISM="Pterosperma sp., Strain CCMP1384" /LENGTH=361 /DNA_ID=CAMNT_0043455597 /DNA_START=143 /DNA_END=1228 /DNA_ORIENTATION=+
MVRVLYRLLVLVAIQTLHGFIFVDAESSQGCTKIWTQAGIEQTREPTKEVLKFLADIHLEVYATNFHACGYTLLEDMVSVTQAELASNLGVLALPHQRRIMAHAAAVAEDLSKPPALIRLTKHVLDLTSKLFTGACLMIGSICSWVLGICWGLVLILHEQILWYIHACMFISTVAICVVGLVLYSDPELRQRIADNAGAAGLTLGYHIHRLHEAGRLMPAVQHFITVLHLQGVVSFGKDLLMKVQKHMEVLETAATSTHPQGKSLEGSLSHKDSLTSLTSAAGLRSAMTGTQGVVSRAGPVSESFLRSDSIADSARNCQHGRRETQNGMKQISNKVCRKKHLAACSNRLTRFRKYLWRDNP